MNEISMKSFDNDLNDCLSQYLNTEPTSAKVQNPFSTSTTASVAKNNFVLPSVPVSKFQEVSTASESKQTLNMSRNTLQLKCDDSSKIFWNKRFQILGFDESEIESQERVIEQKGGIVIRCDNSMNDSSFRAGRKELVDYTIMPMTIPKPISYNCPATVYWMVKN